MWSLLLAANAAATTFVGGDLAGADLLPIDGDVLEGSFTNVGVFQVPAGATVLVDPGTPLEVQAATILIDGVLDGTAAGQPGGLGGAPGGAATAYSGAAGAGPSPGEGGLDGPCVHGGGGGGAGYGGAGGHGGYWFAPPPDSGLPGGTSGVIDDVTSKPLGSGGGGSGSGCSILYLPGEPGGAGGGSITLAASTILIDGEVHADGGSGGEPTADYAGGGGGGSGGSVVIDGGIVDGLGQVTARGGHGGDSLQGIGGLAGGGGGGGGGRIKVFYGTLGTSLTFLVGGAPAGLDQSPGGGQLPAGGAPGTVHQELANLDVDADGVDIPLDNCPTVANPYQEDVDGDGLGDACDLCPTDPSGDSDGDGVCDGSDICPGGDDFADQDGDTVPDECDPCPFDFPDDSDGDTVCDRQDVCDGVDDLGPDADGDGVPDDCDLCPTSIDPDQEDQDLDGFGDACDCAPADPAAYPDAPESCNGADDDCDGEIDELGSTGGDTWYLDVDGDGQGDPATAVEACDPPAGYVQDDRDCDDDASAVYVGAVEVCDGLDNDCDGGGDPPSCDGAPDGKGGPDSGGCGCDGAPRGSRGLSPALILGVRRRR